MFLPQLPRLLLESDLLGSPHHRQNCTLKQGGRDDEIKRDDDLERYDSLQTIKEKTVLTCYSLFTLRILRVLW